MANVSASYDNQRFDINDENELVSLLEELREGNPEEDLDETDLTLSFEFGPLNGLEFEAEMLGEALDFVNKINGMYDYEEAAVYYLHEELRYDLDDIISKWEDVMLHEGDVKGYAEEYVNDQYGNEDEFMLRYFDYDSFAHDLEVGGDCMEFYYNGIWTCINANNL